MPTAADVQAAIDQIDGQLNTGVTQMAENGRMMRFDLTALRLRRQELVTQLATLQPGPPPMRRILTYARGKGL